MYPCFGLIIVCSRKPVPLKGISVDVQVKGFVADVSATLKYENLEENAVEAIFVFPMDDGSAVYSFEAIVEGKKIVADIQEKEQAHKTYDKAISQGQQAFLLEEDKSSRDIFSCRVGNLLPGQEAEVTLCYVRELPLEADGAVRFVLPAVLNPRYTPAGENPSVTAARPRVPIGQIPYTLSLSAHIQSAYGISKIESNCDITPMEYTDSDKTAAKVSLVDGHKFERDVELLVYYLEVNKPCVIMEAGVSVAGAVVKKSWANLIRLKLFPKKYSQNFQFMNPGSVMAEPVVMLNFLPSFPELQKQIKHGEFIFLMDRSGSMGSRMNPKRNSPKRIESAKETLVLLLKSLPLGCYFNIFGFGSHFESFFPESMEYTQKSMEEAVNTVNQMKANFGGTEILTPLKQIYSTKGRPDHPRQLFVFTDGEVGNTKQVIEEVQRNSPNHRCFTFGIGEGASTSLIKGMAGAGSGTCEFITGDDRMQSKVLKALRHALQPIVKEITLKWSLPPGLKCVPLCNPPHDIFQGQRYIAYCQLNGKVNEKDTGEVCLEYKYNDENVKNILPLPLDFGKAERPTIHRLAAKALISELENGGNSHSEETKKRILETSIGSGVISSLTAYVAVNKETKEPLKVPPLRRDIPAPDLMWDSGIDLQATCRTNLRSLGDSFIRRRSSSSVQFCNADKDLMWESATALKAKCIKNGGFPMLRSLGVYVPDRLSSSPPLCGSANKVNSVERCFKDEDICSTMGPKVDGGALASFRLISLQNADGSWDLGSKLASIIGVGEDLLRQRKPQQIVDDSVWATLLAVIWLHASCSEKKDEWELLERKAVWWINDKAGSSLSELVEAGNELLRSSVDLKVFGLSQ